MRHTHPASPRLLSLVCVAVALLLGRSDAPAPVVARPARDAAALAFDDLRDGDVAMIAGDTLAGRFVLSISGPGARYSHCGVLVRTGDGWSLVHSAPENTATGDTGRTEVVPLDDFVRRESVRLIEVYRHRDAATASRAADAALDYVGTPFDAAFDLGDDDRLYCSELVWRAFLNAGATCPLRGAFDDVRGVLLAGPLILPGSLADSEDFQRIGVMPLEAKALQPSD